MIEADSPEIQSRIEEILRTDNPARNIQYQLLIGGDDFTELITELEYGTEDGPAIVWDGKLYGRIPKEKEGEAVVFNILINNMPVRTFTGNALRPETRGFSTQLMAATPGFWLDKIILNKFTEFHNTKPSQVIFSVVYKAPYQHGLVHVEQLEIPRFNRVGDDGFSAIATVSDVLETLREEIPFSAQDRANGGFIARKPPVLGISENIVWEFDVDRDIVWDDDGPSFEYTRSEESYYDVLVYKSVNGDIQEVERIKIEGSKAPVGATLAIEITDDTADFAKNAQQTAYDAATKYQYGEYEGEFRTQYIHPFLERGDIVTVREVEYDNFGATERLWYCLIEGYKHFPMEREATYQCRMNIIQETRLEDTPPPTDISSDSVVDMESLQAQRNLLSFNQSSAEGGTTSEIAAVQSTLGVDTVDKYSGTYSFKSTATTANVNYGIQTRAGLLNQRPVVKEGDTVTGSTRFKAPAGKSVSIQTVLRSTDDLTYYGMITRTVTATGGWDFNYSSITNTFTPNDVIAHINVYQTSSIVVGDVLHIDNLQIEKGNNPTSWQPGIVY